MLWLAAWAGSATVPSVLAAAPPQPAVTMAQAIKMVEQKYHASVVKGESQKEGSRTVYVLKLYNKSAGKAWNVRVDAASGAIL
jgi:uncharacterized membrane protein YkoI